MDWIFRGVGGAVAKDPPYPAWPVFLDWLDTSPVKPLVQPWMMKALRGVELPEGSEPAVEDYRSMLVVLLAWRGRHEDRDPDDSDG